MMAVTRSIRPFTSAPDGPAAAANAGGGGANPAGGGGGAAPTTAPQFAQNFASSGSGLPHFTHMDMRVLPWVVQHASVSRGRCVRVCAYGQCPRAGEARGTGLRLLDAQHFV